MINEVADTLEKAADLIETVGHCKGTAVQWDNEYKQIAYCASGAIAQVLGSDWTVNSAADLNELHMACITALAVQPALAELSGDTWAGTYNPPMDRVVLWNDKDSTTADQVVDLMKHTAKDLRNRGEQHE